MNTIIVETNNNDILLKDSVMPNNFPFKKFKIIMNFNGDLKYKVSVELFDDRNVETNSDCFKAKVEYLNEKCELIASGVDFCGISFLGGDEDRWEQQISRCELAVILVYKICNYIMSAPKEKVIKEKIKVDVNKAKRKNIASNNQKKIYLLREIIEYVQDNNFQSENKSTHKISCDCWGVRGHYRHYKSGKVVFIKEYKKGKNRDKKEPQGKIYTV
jgi:hypothetical protein